MSNFKVITWSENDELYGDRALVSSNACLDGASTRRRAIISLLSHHHSVEVLSLKDGGSLSGHINAIREIDHFLGNGVKCDVVLLFYPDFPVFHPPSVVKLFFLKWLCRKISNFTAAVNAEFFLDIVDLPLFQSKDLGYRLRLSPSFLKYGEKILFQCAHRLIVPASWFTTVLANEYGVHKANVRIVNNGVFSQTVTEAYNRTLSISLPEKDQSKVRFFYSGSLSKEYSRAIPELVDSFIAVAAPEAELYLAGDGGQWLLQDRYVKHRIHYLGHLGELDCILAGSKMDFGLVPYPEGDYFNNCFPSKLGMYVAASLPVLSSDLDETVRFIREFHRGESRSYESFRTFFSDATDLLEQYAGGSAKADSSAKEGVSSYWWDEMALGAFNPGY